jgi:hypothetical protein
MDVVRIKFEAAEQLIVGFSTGALSLSVIGGGNKTEAG